jgi:hypothetical protein
MSAVPRSCPYFFASRCLYWTPSNGARSPPSSPRRAPHHSGASRLWSSGPDRLRPASPVPAPAYQCLSGLVLPQLSQFCRFSCGFFAHTRSWLWKTRCLAWVHCIKKPAATLFFLPGDGQVSCLEPEETRAPSIQAISVCFRADFFARARERTRAFSTQANSSGFMRIFFARARWLEKTCPRVWVHCIKIAWPGDSFFFHVTRLVWAPNLR